MPTAATMPTNHALLHDVPWNTYEAMLAGLDPRDVRLVYDRGELEIVTPRLRHERWRTRVVRMIWALSEELGVPVESGGQLLCKREDLRRGVEPDECFWIQNASRMRGKLDFDTALDPMPDLVLEAEDARDLLPRLPILAALGISEVWRFDGRRLRVHVLDDRGEYRESSTSRAFPWLPLEAFARHLIPAATEGDELHWILAFRQWVREHVSIGG